MMTSRLKMVVALVLGTQWKYIVQAMDAVRYRFAADSYTNWRQFENAEPQKLKQPITHQRTGMQFEHKTLFPGDPTNTGSVRLQIPN